MYTIQSYDTGEGGLYGHELRFDGDHEVFASHFPGNPIVPGAVLVDVIRAVASDVMARPMRVSVVRNVKFITVIVPDSSVSLKVSTRYEEKEEGYLFKSVISDAEKIYAKFDLMLVPDTL